MAKMPSDIRVTIGFEESCQESLDFLEAIFRAGRKRALQDGQNDLAEHYRLRLGVLDFQRAYTKEQEEFYGDQPGVASASQMGMTAPLAHEDPLEVPE